MHYAVVRRRKNQKWQKQRQTINEPLPEDPKLRTSSRPVARLCSWPAKSLWWKSWPTKFTFLILVTGQHPMFCDSSCCLHVSSLPSNHVFWGETTQNSLKQTVNECWIDWSYVPPGHRDEQNLPDGDPTLRPGSVQKHFECSCCRRSIFSLNQPQGRSHWGRPGDRYGQANQLLCILSRCKMGLRRLCKMFRSSAVPWCSR